MDNTQDTTAAKTADYDPTTGYTNVDPDMFLSEDDAQAETSEGGNSDNEEQLITAEQNESESTDTQEQETQAPELFAGKFKSVEDLKTAFAELGGNPDKFKDPAMLEEAYETRQREFSRSRNHIANQERLDQEPEVPDQSLDTESIMREIRESGALDKVESTEDLMKVVIEALVPKLTSQNGMMTREDVQKIVVESAEREVRLTELHSLETEVPRLKTDTEFRNVFGLYVKQQKDSNDYVDLKTSLKDFVKIGQSLGDEYARQSQRSAADKNASTASTDNGSFIDSPKDEVDDILGAYQAKRNIFG